MRVSQISVPEEYKNSADFRFFIKLFDLALTKLNYDVNNMLDLYDPLRCPEKLLWMLADTMGYKYDDRLPSAFCRLVLTYFASMIRLKGSRDGVILAAEVNLDQFNILDYGKEKEILYNRLEDTTIPVNAVAVTEHPDEGYFDLVYFCDTPPVDACIEYVRPLGMYCFQHAGVSYGARTKISIDARLTNYNDINITTGTTRVGHYSREDYARMQKMEYEGGNYSTSNTDEFEKDDQGHPKKYMYDESIGEYVPYQEGMKVAIFYKDSLGCMYRAVTSPRLSIVNAGHNYSVGDILVTQDTASETDPTKRVYAYVSSVDNDGRILRVAETTLSSENHQYRYIIDEPGKDYEINDILATDVPTQFVRVTNTTSALVISNVTGLREQIHGMVDIVVHSPLTTPSTENGEGAKILALQGEGAVINSTITMYYAVTTHSSINPLHTRALAWRSNSAYEDEHGGPSVNAGYRTLYSLQLCNNEHIVKSLVPPIFDLGYGPQDVDVVYPDNYYEYSGAPFNRRGEMDDFTKPYNLRLNKYVEDTTSHDVHTLDRNRKSTIIDPAPKVNDIMGVIGEVIISNVEDHNKQDLSGDPKEFVDSKGNKFYRDAFGRMYLKNDD